MSAKIHACMYLVLTMVLLSLVSQVSGAGKWELSSTSLEKNEDTDSSAYTNTYLLTGTSSSFVCHVKSGGGDWSSSASWQSPPSTLVPGEKIRMTGTIIRVSDNPGLFASDSLWAHFIDPAFTSEFSKTSKAEVYSTKYDPNNPSSATWNSEIEVPGDSTAGSSVILQVMTGAGNVYYTYTYDGSQKCDRLNVDLQEGTNINGVTFSVIATVIEICDHNPLPGANLEFRVFHTYDEATKKPINGEYVDYESPGMITKDDGTYEFWVQNTIPGDMYRVDAYASKDGWDRSDSSIHVTAGQGGDRYGELGSRWNVREINEWEGTWIRRPGTGIFDATWTNSKGETAVDILEVQSVQDGVVKIFRRGNGGLYTGNFISNTLIEGIASWYSEGMTWIADIEY